MEKTIKQRKEEILQSDPSLSALGKYNPEKQAEVIQMIIEEHLERELTLEEQDEL